MIIFANGCWRWIVIFLSFTDVMRYSTGTICVYDVCYTCMSIPKVKFELIMQRCITKTMHNYSQRNNTVSLKPFNVQRANLSFGVSSDKLYIYIQQK